MKRCPKCNRTYTTDTQKFCTHDGVVLEVLGVSQGDTIRIDSVQIDDEAPTKAISRDLPSEVTGGFDPFKTVMSRPEETTANRPRDTQDLAPPTSTPLPSPPVREVMVDTSPGAPSPSQPTMQLSGSAATSAPLPPPPSAPLPAQPPVTPRPRAKKSRLPLVLGILAVLLVLGIGVLGVAYVFVVKPMLAARRAPVVEPSPTPANEPTPIVETTPNNAAKTNTYVAPEPPPYSPPADAVEFVNSKEHLDGQLAEHYVDFSFYYPNRWEKDPKAGVPGARNFAQVERRLPPDFTQENFAVAWNSSAAPVAENRALFHTLAENLSAQFEKSKKFPEYRKVSEGETKVGVYDGYEFRFEGSSLNTAKGDLKLWGRVIFLPPQDGGKNGVTLLMLATSLAPELKTVKDIGVKGELPMMLQSFRFGKK